MVRAHHDQLPAALDLGQNGRRVSVALFGRRAGHPRRFPALAAGLQVVGHQIAGRLAIGDVGQRVLHADRNNHVAINDGAIGVAPPDRVRAVVLLQIAAPALLAGKVVGRQIAVAEMHDHRLAVGDRRRAGEIMKLMKNLLLALGPGAGRGRLADGLRPFDGAGVARQPRDQQFLVMLRGDKHGVAPDRGRAAAPLGQRRLPNQFRFGGPGHRQSGFQAGAVAARSAPLRPILGP